MTHGDQGQLITDAVELAELLISRRDQMLEPQDLPGRYGKAVAAIDRVLKAIEGAAVVGGGWAVWRHGYVARVTRDIDIVVAADQIDSFLQAAAVSGFEVLHQVPGRWPKLRHKESDVDIDILPEAQRPGTPPDYAPTTIPSPHQLGARPKQLRYIPLPALIELKLAAGRLKDKADVAELIRANPAEVAEIRRHLGNVHATYLAQFDDLRRQVIRDQTER